MSDTLVITQYLFFHVTYLMVNLLKKLEFESVNWVKQSIFTSTGGHHLAY